MKAPFSRLLFFATFLLITGKSFAQKPTTRVVAGIYVNYSEDSVGEYTLPDPLTMLNGKKVTTPSQWNNIRRQEIVKLYETNQYGKAPEKPTVANPNVFDRGTVVFDGKVIRKQVTVYLTKDTAAHKMDLLIYLPAHAKKPVPILFNVSFTANSNMVNDPGIKPGEVWTKEGKKIPAQSGTSFGKINIDPFIEAGYGVAMVYYGDIEPDFPGGIEYGIRGYYLKPGTTQPDPDQWGAIAAWSWGLARAMDYFETDKQINAKQIALLGISRLGKTVLWTGATDTRYAMIIASCSGEGGAALSRRNYGETIKLMSHPTRYFYQFAANYQRYGDSVNSFPIDAHMLVSLIAPRPLLLQTGDQDYWSDPKGEFLAGVAASPVYQLLGKKGFQTNEMPKAGVLLSSDLGYYMHTGGHGMVPSDQDIFLEYMKIYFK